MVKAHVLACLVQLWYGMYVLSLSVSSVRSASVAQDWFWFIFFLRAIPKYKALGAYIQRG